jgi:ribonucleoside-diphosphate reductase alpha chain
MKGYVSEACPECGNFTMVRNGTCLKCDTIFFAVDTSRI